MKRTWIAFVVAVMGIGSVSQSFAATLFTTQEDFAQWSNANYATVAVVGGTDSSTTNGYGNTTAAGATGATGAMSVTRVTGGTFDYFYSAGEQGNAGFFTAMGASLSGSVLTGGSTSVIVDHSSNPTPAGDYFQLGIVLNYTGHFTQVFGTTVDNGNGTSTTTIPVTIDNVAALSYFQIGFIVNSNLPVGSTFTVDNVRTTVAVPEPAAMGVLSLVGLLGLRRRH